MPRFHRPLPLTAVAVLTALVSSCSTRRPRGPEAPIRDTAVRIVFPDPLAVPAPEGSREPVIHIESLVGRVTGATDDSVLVEVSSARTLEGGSTRRLSGLTVPVATDGEAEIQVIQKNATAVDWAIVGGLTAAAVLATLYALAAWGGAGT